MVGKRNAGYNNIYWNKEYLDQQLKNGKTYVTIARDNHIGRSTVQRALNRYGLTKPSADWDSDEVALLKSNYGKDVNFKSYFPHRSLCSIYHKAHKLGLENNIKPRRYRLAENFFKEWTGGMAYVLGWLFSDGNVDPKMRTFRLKLAIKDIGILRKIRYALGSNARIGIVNQALPSKKSINQYALLAIHSRNMCMDLLALGCTPKKTNKFIIPGMPSSVARHFIRGYFDGDGSISFNRPNTIRLRIVSSNAGIIYWMADVFRESLNIPRNIKKVENIWQCEYYGNNARAICSWMYSDCGELYLERKRKRYILHLEKWSSCINRSLLRGKTLGCHAER
ncbi:MAG: LAGLIDADG family homing endonuclease [Candidatus Micrarchaeota archaeon]